MKSLAVAFALTIAGATGLAAQSDAARWAAQARNITIIRDDWGIAHVFGRSDADAVFGMIYAQAEDDFNRIETNYLDAMGRLAEAEGEGQIWHDLRARLFTDPDSARALYRTSPPWLKQLMTAWADGLNFYLSKHPDVHPRVITHFEPWMALTFSEGSIGPDVERIDLAQLSAFYGNGAPPAAASGGSGDGETPVDPTGSNGIAVAPSNTVNHHALFLINPHTSFFFRDELQMTSEQGLHAYGAATWGQFFLYQGWNDHLGWMHTSSGVDAIDQWLETVVMHGDKPFYKYGAEERPMTASTITIAYRNAAGTMAERRFTVYRTHHGPIVARAGDKWMSFAIMNDPMHALIESYTRTKARNLQEFRRTVELRTNSSNNTVYADGDGNIAYFQASFIPRRDTSFDWKRPMDGSNPATDWHGLLTVDEMPHIVNPAGGWIYNSNDPPWTAAGPDSPRKADFPAYVDNGGESARGHHAVRVLQNTHDFTRESLQQAAFDSYLTWFEKPIPALLHAWDAAADNDPMKARLRDQIEALRGWDLRWGANSVPTTLAIFWAENTYRRSGRAAREAGVSVEDYLGSRATVAELLDPLAAAADTIAARFGSWRTPWGGINRFQRLDDAIAGHFDDTKASIPVPFAPGTWGSLASFAARAYPNTRKRYGSSGNSFVAVVEFGDSVRARAVTAGGISGDPGSRHFADEAQRYADGNLRDVYFYRTQLQGHTEREYHPGG
ncbi:MAG TPA: penicillin acylase family protein [Gemmatimonadales bacterium]|jgi:acyl-homoserine lactone acylase PvdQ